VDTIAKAHQRAQRRFHRMIVEATYGDPNNRHTRLYVQAERLLDGLVANAPESALNAYGEALFAEADERADQELAIFLPDVPVAVPLAEIPFTWTPIDAWPELEARAMWGDR
jgi:hypothetical protein